MALSKEIKQEDGVVTNYHRILFLRSTINQHISIAVLSYIDEVSRERELLGEKPYKVAVTYEKPYEENMTVEEAYEYLKTLPAFESAEDVLEDTAYTFRNEETVEKEGEE